MHGPTTTNQPVNADAWQVLGQVLINAGRETLTHNEAVHSVVVARKGAGISKTRQLI